MTLRRTDNPLLWLSAASLLAAALYSAILVYPTVFSGRELFGDETYVLVSLRSYVEAGGLYSETYSQYGPGFYSLVGSIYDLFDLHLASLDPGRWLTLLFIVLTGLFSGLAVRLATQSGALSVVSVVFVSGYLVAPQVSSPLHPGHLIALALAVIAFLLLWQSSDTWPIAALGATVAALALIKINVGGIALIGIAAGAMASGASRRFRRLGQITSIGLPIGLLAADASLPWARSFAGAVVAAVVVTHVGLGHGRRVMIEKAVAIRFALSTVAAGLVLIGPVLLRGSSPMDVLTGALIAPMNQRNAFTVPLLTDPVSWWAVAAAGVVGIAVWLHRRSESLRYPWVAGMKLVAGALSLVLLADSPRLNLSATLLLTAVAALPLCGYAERAILGRRVLVMVAVLQPLHAYPVAGDQVWWGSLLLVIVGFVNVGDGLRGVIGNPPEGIRVSDWWPSGALRAAVVSTVLVAIVGSAGLSPLTEYETFSEREQIALPGSGSVRVERGTARLYREMTELLLANCDSYYSDPGINFYYLFAEMPLVTGQNATHWRSLFDAGAQAEAVADIEGFRGALCLLSGDESGFWVDDSRVDLPGPLHELVDDFTVEVGRVQGYVLYGPSK